MDLLNNLSNSPNDSPFSSSPSALSSTPSNSNNFTLASAFASVSEMANKSIFSFNDNSSPSLAEKHLTRNSSIFKAFKAAKRTVSEPTRTGDLDLDNNNNNVTNETKSSSILPDSITATASSVLNKINPFESTNTNNENQKAKQNIFSKFEQKSKSLSSAVFGSLYDNEEDTKSCLNKNNSNSYNENNSLEMSTQTASSNNQISNESLERNSIQGLSSNGSIKKKTKPVGSLEYKVEPGDTLEKIALKWNTVPSEIQHLNRLAIRVIFPGQTIYVPDPDYVPPPPTPPPTSPISKVQLPQTIINELNTLDPNRNQSSQQQQQHQQQNSNNSSGFKMFRWKSGANPKPGHVEKQKYHSIDISNEKQDIDEGSEHKKPPLNRRHTITEEEAKQLDEECMQRFLKINSKIVTRSKGVFDGVLLITPSAIMFDPIDSSANSVSSDNRDESGRALSSNSTSNIYDEASAIIPIEIISNVIMYEDLSLKDVQEYFDYQYQLDLMESDLNSQEKEQTVSFNLNNENPIVEPSAELNTSGNENNEVFSEDTAKSEASFKTAASERADSDKIEVVEKPKEDAESNKTDEKSDSSSNEAKSSKIASTSALNAYSSYLCIKVNKNKDFITCPLNRKMKNRIISEFWFQINDTSTDKICAFFLEWKSDPTFALTQDAVPKGRFQLVKNDEKLADLIADNLLANSLCLKINKSFSTTNRLINKDTNFVKDWEIVNLHELESKIKKEIEMENEAKTLPTLINKSTILKEEHLRKLNLNLIPRAVGYNWVLSFSTEANGFSLSTMYRTLAEVDTPCLIVIMDTNRNIFGAMTSNKLYQSDHFYGTGESFLYTFFPTFKVFKWTGENNFFTRGCLDSISFGCGEGYHGLWFDGDLLNGHSQKSKTYDNEPLSSTEFFTIAALEVWSFSD